MSEKFGPEVLEWYGSILERFPGERTIKSPTEANVRCSAHDDRNPSCGIDLRSNGRGPEIMINCRSGRCECKEILANVGLTVGDLHYATGAEARKAPRGDVPGCSLEHYAQSKRLSVEFLTGPSIGLEEGTWTNKGSGTRVPCVLIPYCARDGSVVRLRFRTALHKVSDGPDARFRWGEGNVLLPYGLHRLEEAEKAGYVLVMEGESDAHVAWWHGLPAVGVPGANNWRDDWSAYFDDVPLLLVLSETDTAAEMLWRKLSSCEALRGRVQRADLI